MVAASSADILDTSLHRERCNGSAGSSVLRINSSCLLFQNTGVVLVVESGQLSQSFASFAWKERLLNAYSSRFFNNVTMEILCCVQATLVSHVPHRFSVENISR